MVILQLKTTKLETPHTTMVEVNRRGTEHPRTVASKFLPYLSLLEVKFRSPSAQLSNTIEPNRKNTRN